MDPDLFARNDLPIWLLVSFGARRVLAITISDTNKNDWGLSESKAGRNGSNLFLSGNEMPYIVCVFRFDSVQHDDPSCPDRQLVDRQCPIKASF
jgi:hypothetical protein